MLKKLLSALLALAAASAFAAVDINSATSADLDSIKGIGPSTSNKILEQRKTAKFKDWNDLIQRVPGIGEKRAARLSTEGLTVNGETFKATGTPMAKKVEAKTSKDGKGAMAAPAPMTTKP
jgi:competence protein ComEA